MREIKITVGERERKIYGGMERGRERERGGGMKRGERERMGGGVDNI
jgi:hypothetical protein